MRFIRVFRDNFKKNLPVELPEISRLSNHQMGALVTPDKMSKISIGAKIRYSLPGSNPTIYDGTLIENGEVNYVIDNEGLKTNLNNKSVFVVVNFYKNLELCKDYSMAVNLLHNKLMTVPYIVGTEIKHFQKCVFTKIFIELGV